MRKKVNDVDIDGKMLVQQIYCDICNGLTRSECVHKLQNGMYEIGRYKDKNLKQAQAYRLVQKSVNLMLEESEKERNIMRSELYNRLLSIYQDAVEQNDRSNAIRSLEVMAKLTGMFSSDNQTNIQINSADGDVKINFGFNTDSVND